LSPIRRSGTQFSEPYQPDGCFYDQHGLPDQLARQLLSNHARRFECIVGLPREIRTLVLVVFLVPVTLIIHNISAVSNPAAAKMQRMMFMKNLIMLGGALIIGYFGTGPLSLDSRAESIPTLISGGQRSKTATRVSV
jgi:hypothetical protein